MTKTSFSPTVLLQPEGITITPPGWVWVLAFALRGVQWAVDEASKPEFTEVVRQWHLARAEQDALESLEYHEREATTQLARLASIRAQQRGQEDA